MIRSFLALLLFATGATGPVQAAPERLKIGAIYGLTGLLPDFGDEFLKGARLYVDQTPADKRHIELFVEDSAWDSKTAVSAFRKLVDGNGVRAVHVMGSGPSLAIKPLAESLGVLLLSAGAHPALTPKSSLVLRHSNLASEDARVLAEALAPKLAENAAVATIFLQNDWGQSYNEEFCNVLKRARPSLRLVSEPHLAADTDFRPVLLRVLRSAPDALVLNSTGAALANIVQQARQSGYRGPLYLNNGLALSREVQERIRSLGDEQIYWQRYPEVPEGFEALFSTKYGRAPGYFSLAAYSDLELLDSLAATAGAEPRKLVAAAKSLGVFKGRFAELSISSAGDILIPTTVERFR